MTKVAPAGKTTMSSTVSLLRVFIIIIFSSRIVEFDVNDIYIYIYTYIYIYIYELVLQKYIDIIIIIIIIIIIVMIMIIIIKKNYLICFIVI